MALQKQIVNLETDSQHDVNTKGGAKSRAVPIMNRLFDLEFGHENGGPNPPRSLAYSN